MSAGRFLAKKVSHNEALAGVSLEAALLFTWCLPHVDRDGRMVGHPALVKATAVPLVAGIPEGLVPLLLEELVRAGLVQWYRADGKAVLAYPRFRENQRGTSWYGKEAESIYPPHGPGVENLKADAFVAPHEGPVLFQPGTGSRRVDVATSESEPVRMPVAPEDAERDRPTYTEGELEEAAANVLGLGQLSRKELSTNHRLLLKWLYSGHPRDSVQVWMAIHGAALLARDGEAGDSWLRPGVAYGLRVLEHTRTLAKVFDGKAVLPLWDVAIQRYLRDEETKQPRRTVRGGDPSRVGELVRGLMDGGGAWK